MALICRLCRLWVFRCPTGLIFRVFNNGTFSQKYLKFSTSRIVGKINDTPIKYTTNKVAKIDISEIIGLKSKKEERSEKISKFIILFSLVSFLIYFCILREENDLDEMLKGSSEGKILLPELMKLKLDLNYCKKMNLPTDAIKARIEELEKQQKVSSPFIK